MSRLETEKPESRQSGAAGRVGEESRQKRRRRSPTARLHSPRQLLITRSFERDTERHIQEELSADSLLERLRDTWQSEKGGTANTERSQL